MIYEDKVLKNHWYKLKFLMMKSDEILKSADFFPDDTVCTCTPTVVWHSTFTDQEKAIAAVAFGWFGISKLI